jgi:hypothetical protein
MMDVHVLLHVQLSIPAIVTLFNDCLALWVVRGPGAGAGMLV